MKTSMPTKIKILIKAIKVFKNWYIYPLVYFRFIKKDHIIFETSTGLKIKLRTHSTDLIALTNVWFVEEYSKLGFKINDDDVIIDIGAHIGLFTLFASQFCKKGTIFCFEPIKENYNILLSNLKLNNLGNVKPFNLAVSSSDTNVTLFFSKDEAGHSMFVDNSKPIRVNSTSLKKILDGNSIEHCDLIKLDCEGAEYEIIQSLPLSYFKRISKMIIEYHFVDSKPTLINELTEKLKIASFQISTIPHSSDMGLIYAINREFPYSC